jgi:ubiquinone/menaquinone biosynthesis C-methylase UbiE
LKQRIIKNPVNNYIKKECIDLACGSGQATKELSKYYEKVIGVDSSQSQLDYSFKKENITYINSKAEELIFENETIDIITIATGLHWMDIEKTMKEIDRVLKNKGVLCVWGYFTSRTENEEINQLINNFLKESLELVDDNTYKVLSVVRNSMKNIKNRL